MIMKTDVNQHIGIEKKLCLGCGKEIDLSPYPNKKYCGKKMS